MSRESAADKSRRYLLEGRLRILEVDGNRVVAECRGDGRLYTVAHAHGRWSCSCPARTIDCAHALATKLVVVTEDRVDG